MKPGSMAAFEAARNIEDALDERDDDYDPLDDDYGANERDGSDHDQPCMGEGCLNPHPDHNLDECYTLEMCESRDARDALDSLAWLETPEADAKAVELGVDGLMHQLRVLRSVLLMEQENGVVQQGIAQEMELRLRGATSAAQRWKCLAGIYRRWICGDGMLAVRCRDCCKWSPFYEKVLPEGWTSVGDGFHGVCPQCADAIKEAREG